MNAIIDLILVKKFLTIMDTEKQRLPTKKNALELFEREWRKIKDKLNGN